MTAWPTVRSGPSGAAARSDGDEAGETLLEILMAVILMGVAIVGIVGGVLSLIRVTGEVRATTEAANHSQAVAEALKQPVVANPDEVPEDEWFTYVPCAEVDDYELTEAVADLDAPSGFSAEIVAVEYLDAVGADGPTWRSTCSGEDDDRGLQRVTVEVTTGTGVREAQERVRVIKRDARCEYSPSFDNVDQGPC